MFLKRVAFPIAILLFVGVMSAACTPTNAPTSTQVASVTDTPVATATSRPTATPSSTFTATPTRTPSRTPSPSHTPSATPTDTPTLTPTPRPTQPPTATPTAARAHIDRTTLEFSPDAFIKSMRDLQFSFQVWKDYFGHVVGKSGTGNCSTFTNRRADWYGAFAYGGVPGPWQALYFEYIALADNAVVVTMPLSDICAAGGGTISEEMDKQIFNYFETGQNRLHQMIQEAQALRDS